MLDEAVVVHDAHGQLVYLNDAAARWLGFAEPRGGAGGDPGRAAGPLPGLVRGRQPRWTRSGSPSASRTAARRGGGSFGSRAGRGAESAGSRSTRRRSTGPDGRTLYAVTTVEDVTELKRSEFAQQLLARTGELLALVDRLSRDAPGGRPARRPEFADWCSVNIPDRDGLVERVAIAHTDPERIAPVEQLREQHPVRVDDGTPLAEVIRTGAPRLIAELPGGPRRAMRRRGAALG